MSSLDSTLTADADELNAPSTSDSTMKKEDVIPKALLVSFAMVTLLFAL